MRAGRTTGAATAPKLRSTALGAQPQASSSGQPASADAASGQAAEAAEQVLTYLALTRTSSSFMARATRC